MLMRLQVSITKRAVDFNLLTRQEESSCWRHSASLTWNSLLKTQARNRRSLKERLLDFAGEVVVAGITHNPAREYMINISK